MRGGTRVLSTSRKSASCSSLVASSGFSVPAVWEADFLRACMRFVLRLRGFLAGEAMLCPMHDVKQSRKVA